MQLVENVETEAQAAARIRKMKTRKALETAPSLVAHLRRVMMPADGRTERGEWKLYQRTPLLTGVADAADELYVVLRGWAGEWARELGEVEPVGEMWRNGQTAHASDEFKDAIALGFRAGVSDARARRLVTRAAAFLCLHENAIGLLPFAATYQDEITELIWDLRSASRYVPPARKGASMQDRLRDGAVVSIATRVCGNPLCGEDEVRVEYFGEPMAYAEARNERILLRDMGDDSDRALNEFASVLAGVTVRCAVCGWVPPATPSKIAKWLS
jgi:hypothetical protein